MRCCAASSCSRSASPSALRLRHLLLLRLSSRRLLLRSAELLLQPLHLLLQLRHLLLRLLQLLPCRACLLSILGILLLQVGPLSLCLRPEHHSQLPAASTSGARQVVQPDQPCAAQPDTGSTRKRVGPLPTST